MKKTAVLLLMIFAAYSLFAATIVVNNSGDSGAGTLRQAVSDASDGDDIIFVLTSGNETITLSSQISISGKGINIDASNMGGSGIPVTVQVSTPGMSTYRVFYLNAMGKTNSISDMTIKGGDVSAYPSAGDNWGGSISLVEGSLSLNKVTIQGSKAAYGGGICAVQGASPMSLSITNSTVSTCQSTSNGAGVCCVNVSILMSNSTFKNNSSAADGGAIATADQTFSKAFNINNCTFFDNTAVNVGGGFCILEGSCTLSNCTFAHNSSSNSYGGGVGLSHNQGTLTFNNCLLVNNTGNDYYYGAGTLVDNGYNVVEYQSGASTGAGKTFNSVTDILYNTKADGTTGYSSWNIGNADLSNQTLNLAFSLSYNGGYTETLPVTGSGFLTASEGSGSSGEDQDQRGYYRNTSGSRIDTRGAFQYDGVIAKIGSVDWTTSSATYSTIGSAYDNASTGNTINLAATAIYESGIDLDETKTVTIQGDDAGSSIVQADDTPGTASARVFNISAGDVTLQDMTIRHGKTGSSGAVDYGAGIQIGNNTVTMNRCIVTNNNSGANGGAIDVYQGTLNVSNSTIAHNDGYHGGGVYAFEATINMINSTVYNNISDNSGSSYGGGLCLIDGTATVKFGTICNNSCGASNGGGGIENDGNALTISNSLIANNNANGSANDFDNFNGTVTDNGYNIVETSAGFTWNASGDISGNQASLFGTSKSSQILADNGGITPTLAIESGSVAIDAGQWDALVTTDQRGGDREDPPTIGAYESGADLASSIELLSLNAEAKNGGVQLNWRTETETENLGFMIQRKEVGQSMEDWIVIASYQWDNSLEGFGSTSEKHDYEFVDTEVQPGKAYTYRLGDVDYSGIITWHKVIDVTVESENMDLPIEFGLHNAYPNPFNPCVTLNYGVNEDSDIMLEVYNMHGQLVDVLDNSYKLKGNYVIKWHPGDLSSGVYIVQLKAGNLTHMQKIVFVK